MKGIEMANEGLSAKPMQEMKLWRRVSMSQARVILLPPAARVYQRLSLSTASLNVGGDSIVGGGFWRQSPRRDIGTRVVRSWSVGARAGQARRMAAGWMMGKSR